MFCNCEPCEQIEEYDSMQIIYKVIDLDNNDLKNSRNIVNKFLEINKKSGNFWKTTRITDEIHTDCFGKSISMPVIIYQDKLFENLLDESINILNNFGFNVEYPDNYDDSTQGLIEIHYANSDTIPVYSKISINNPNDNYYKLFVHVDVDCIGGELDIYDKNGDKLVNTISTKCNDTNKTRCIILDGNSYYKQRNIISGHSVVISYQYRKDYDYEEYESDEEFWGCTFKSKRE